ncbi:MAG: cytochrome c5 family protein [Acidiferrobacteraceae bacterium]|nr:cytochrome c5 family protein [Acidiferrobacteraceae bacterium]
MAVPDSPTANSLGRLPIPIWAGPGVFITVALAVLVFFWWFLSSPAAGPENQALQEKTLREQLAPVGKMLVTKAGAQVNTANVSVDGEAVYQSACAVCHATGIAGAPQLGDQDLWRGRVAAGPQALYGNAINGFQGATGIMPPRGGNAALGEAQVRAAVDYMLAALE